MSKPIPQIISGDECLLPGGPRVVKAPADGWQSKSYVPLEVYAIGAASLTFFLGFFLALLAVGVSNRTAGRAPLNAHDQPVMMAAPVACNPRVDEGCP